MILVVQIEGEVFDICELLIPAIQRFDIDSSNIAIAILSKISHQIAADKSSGACNQDQFVAHSVSPESEVES
jgi:hypothetical protein